MEEVEVSKGVSFINDLEIPHIANARGRYINSVMIVMRQENIA